MSDQETIIGEVVMDSSALAVITSAEVDQQVATAKRYPRSIVAFRKEAMEMVTLSETVAEDCIFALPRGKEKNEVTGKWEAKFIEGPSVRFSEIIVSAWGNNRSGSRPMGDDGRYVTAQGVFHDLEKNTAFTVEVKRSILNKQGQRFNSDMVGVTTNAACSIAVRNARLGGIPKAIWQELYDAAKKTAIGDIKTLEKKRSDMMAYFMKMNVLEDTIFEFMNVTGLEDIGLDELAILKGIATGIKEGTLSIDKAFLVEGNTRVNKAAQNSKDIKEAAEKVKDNPKVETQVFQTEKTETDQQEDLLQKTYGAVVKLSEIKGETPDDMMEILTKNFRQPMTAMIDLETKAEAFVKDFMITVETEITKAS